MLKNRSDIRSGATAIAAVLAALSTPSLAQDAAPDVPAPAVESTAPVTLDSAPAEATTTSEPAAVSAETAAPEAAAPAKTAAVASTHQSAKRGPTRAATTAPAAKPATATPVADPATAAAPAAPATPAPIAEELPTSTPAPVAKSDNSRTAELGFGGALALLALGGTAAVVRRRRRADDDDDFAFEAAGYETDAEVTAPDPMVTPAPVITPKADAPIPAAGYLASGHSAFSWGNAAKRQETWEERARRGPTPDNPSLSLKKRLKRAAFFDNRERQVASGAAPSVDASAGLPQHSVDAARRPELQPA